MSRCGQCGSDNVDEDVDWGGADGFCGECLEVVELVDDDVCIECREDVGGDFAYCPHCGAEQ